MHWGGWIEGVEADGGGEMRVDDERRKKVQIAIRWEYVDSPVICDGCGRYVTLCYGVFEFVDTDLDFWAEVEEGDEGYIETLCEECLRARGFTPQLWARRLK